MKKIEPLKYRMREELFSDFQWFPPLDPRHDPEETPVKEITNQCPQCGDMQIGDIYLCNDENEEGYGKYCIRIEKDGYAILKPGWHILKSNFGHIAIESDEDLNKHFSLIDN